MLTKGNGQEGTKAAAGPKLEFVSLADIRNVERAVLPHPAKSWFINTDLDASGGYRTKMGPQNHSVPIAESQHHVINPTNPGRALDDGVEHRLHVRRRTTDDPKHLGRCGLMLQGLAQFRVALLDLLEQSHVLDRDDRLVGEGFEELDLLFREGADYSTTNDDDADRLVLAHEGRNEYRSDAEALDLGEAFRKLSSGDGEQIFNMNYIAVDDRTANSRVATDCH